MGIKAVSTPILASETAVGFWRGSAILAWQLWFVDSFYPVVPFRPVKLISTTGLLLAS